MGVERDLGIHDRNFGLRMRCSLSPYPDPLTKERKFAFEATLYLVDENDCDGVAKQIAFSHSWEEFVEKMREWNESMYQTAAEAIWNMRK